MANLGEAFTYVFADREWPAKFIFGVLFLVLSILLVGIPFIAGYFIEIIRRVAFDERPYLPEWSNLGRLFSRGLIYVFILLVYALPVLVLGCCAAAVGLLAGAGRTDGDLAAGAVSLLFSCLGLPLGLLYSAILPIIAIQYATAGSFGAAFKFDEMWELVRANLGNYIVVALIAWAVSNLIAPLGVVLCGVGILATGFYALTVTAYLYGLFYRSAGRPPTAGPTAAPVLV